MACGHRSADLGTQLVGRNLLIGSQGQWAEVYRLVGMAVGRGLRIWGHGQWAVEGHGQWAVEGYGQWAVEGYGQWVEV